MKSELILIDSDAFVSNVALLGNGKLKEYYVEYRQGNNLTGNIYKGRVVNVLHGLQSAFVHFGAARNGFLSVEETLDHKSVLEGGGVIPKSLGLKAGDDCLVQATKEEIGQKGARLTTNITIPGRYVVYLPTLDFVGVSNKITDLDVRERLIKMLEKCKPAGSGFIARTICLEAKKSDILAEVKRLTAVWKEVKAAYDRAEGVGMIYSDGDLVYRTVRDMLGSDVEAIVCNARATVDMLKERLAVYNPRFSDKVKLYEGKGDMFADYNVFDEVDKLLEHRVDLDCGVSLVFDYTEALTVIDVNTAKFIGKLNHENTVFEANLAAAVEIARQIRLRNIGGIIIIDFIDMVDEVHKEAVCEALRREMLFDRTKSRVVGMSGLGLVEMTRKKVGRELSTVLLAACPHCKGEALTHSADYIARKIKAALKELFADPRYTGAMVTVDGFTAEHLRKSRYFAAECDGVWADKRIYLLPASEPLGHAGFSVKGEEGAIMHLPVSATLLY